MSDKDEKMEIDLDSFFNEDSVSVEGDNNETGKQGRKSRTKKEAVVDPATEYFDASVFDAGDAGSRNTVAGDRRGSNSVPYAKRNGAEKNDSDGERKSNENPRIGIDGDLVSGKLFEHESMDFKTRFKMEKRVLDTLMEMEEKAAKTKGRYIPAIDDAKPGVTFRTHEQDRVYVNEPSFMEKDFANIKVDVKQNENAPGFVKSEKLNPKGEENKTRAQGAISGVDGIFDPGIGAQKEIPVTTKEDQNNPRHPKYLSCVNKLCTFRETCLRYRMHKKRTSHQNLFYPSECRTSGIYQSIHDSDYTAYPSFDSIERGASGVMRLP